MSEKKFGVKDLAAQMGIEPSSVRVQLRNKGIKKNGQSYEWGSKDELKAVADKLRAGGDKPKATKTEAKPAKTDKAKPTAKAPAKKTAPAGKKPAAKAKPDKAAA